MTVSELRAGDWVEVRNREAILATLDGEGRRDGMPFMPEMLASCGRRFRVYKRAHKGCDTIRDWKTMRRLENAVHLEKSRCDGSAHGGCQAACLLYWHTDWLVKVAGPDAPAEAASTAPAGGCTLDALEAATQLAPDAKGGERWRCQATEHLRYTRPLQWWEPGAYIEDLASRNVAPFDFVRFALRALFNVALRKLGLRTHPAVVGTARDKTPTEQLDLKEGELVVVRPAEEIMRTINADRKNRGLTFDVEMTPFCGKRFRVLRRVERIINERTGAMIRMPADCLILDEVFCGGCLSQYRLFCPRAIYPYWREIWLRRVE